MQSSATGAATTVAIAGRERPDCTDSM